MHDLTLRERGQKVIVISCCKANEKFLPSSLILKRVNKKQELGGGEGVPVNRKCT